MDLQSMFCGDHMNQLYVEILSPPPLFFKVFLVIFEATSKTTTFLLHGYHSIIVEMIIFVVILDCIST